MNLLNCDDDQDKLTDDDGLAKTITRTKPARAEAKNSRLFNNGDLLQGSPLGDWLARVPPMAPGQVHPAYKVLNAIGEDAANIGNHAFNDGLPFLRKALSGAAFPTVSAHVHVDGGDGNLDRDEYAFTPSVILDRRFTDEAGAAHTLKIGVIGFVPPPIQVWGKQHLQGRLSVRDIEETITSDFAPVTPDPSMQIVARAQLAYARRALQSTEFEALPLLSAAAPFKAGGRMGWGDHTDIPAGTLSLRNLADRCLYPNTRSSLQMLAIAQAMSVLCT